jgi:hypothetical protein
MKMHVEFHVGCPAWHMELIRIVLWNVRAGRGLKDDLILVSHFTGKENRAQGEELTCPRSHGKIMVIVDLALQFNFKSKVKTYQPDLPSYANYQPSKLFSGSSNSESPKT